MGFVVSSAALLLLLLSAVSFRTITSSSDAGATNTNDDSPVSSQFKAPNTDTPAAIATAWKQTDSRLWSFLESHVPSFLNHTGAAAFDQHLKGVQAVLRFWDAPEHLTAAGLFHSIYGTEGFQGFSLPLSERSAVQKLIGDRAEKLCFVFCMVDRTTLDKTIWEWKEESSMEEETKDSKLFQFRARPELGRFTMELEKEEWLDFLELTLADWLEQVEGAASKPSDVYIWKTGEAYAHRRLAFRKMSEILAVERASRLSKVAPQMYKAVMATEGEETRHLVQMRTPPISKAAVQALDALRAMGEDIPEDFAPRPWKKQDGEAVHEATY